MRLYRAVGPTPTAVLGRDLRAAFPPACAGRRLLHADEEPDANHRAARKQKFDLESRRLREGEAEPHKDHPGTLSAQRGVRA